MASDAGVKNIEQLALFGCWCKKHRAVSSVW